MNIQYATNSSILGADPSQGFFIRGTSACGNIAAVLSLLARDDNFSPPISGVWLSIPLIVHSDAVSQKYRSEYGSYVQNKEAAILDVKAIEWQMST
jgi:acetyl esterase/lipase